MRFSLEVGIARLKQLLQAQYAQMPEEFALLEVRLAKNRSDARLIGDTDPFISGELNRILLELNRFALEHVKVSFNDLCQGQNMPAFSDVNGQRPAKSEVSMIPVASHTPSSYLGNKRRWAVLVGVGTYEDRAFETAPACVNDANKVAEQLYSNGSGFAPANIHLRVDSGIRPTRERILTGLQAVVEEAEEDDLLLFYYSGHGELEQDEAYLITKDSIRGKLKETALAISTLEEMVQSSRAKAKVMILDACHAGERLQRKSASGPPPAFLDRVYAHAEGIVILASCEKHQVSYVWKEKGCSVYTHFLLEALSGKADREAKGFVSVDDIDAHVTNGVQSWIERQKEPCEQKPTRNFRSHGRIIVTYYQQATSSSESSTVPHLAVEGAQPQKQAVSVPTVAPPWSQCDTIVVRGEHYILHKATIEEKPTRDGSGVLRSAEAHNAVKGNRVYVKQVMLSYLTVQGNALRGILKNEHEVALKMVQQRDFPRLIAEEGMSDTASSNVFTLMYEGWEGPTLGAVFQRSNKALEKVEATALMWCVIRFCEVLSQLHRERYSHRALSGACIILANGDQRRPVLRDLGLAGQKGYGGDKERVPLQAPEQRYTVIEWPQPGPCTDIYQLGVLLSTLITGQPFSSIRPGAYAGPLPPGVDEVIARAVATNPKERWPTVSMFANALKQALKAKQE